jgi:hypothetical protein
MRDPGLVVVLEEAEGEEKGMMLEDALDFPEGVPRPTTAQGRHPPLAVLIRNFGQQELAATVVVKTGGGGI